MMPMRNVYLDNSATTRPSDAVVSAMLRVLTENWHNPSALYQPAMQAEKLMTAARETCLKAAGAVGHRLIFTSSGTEADNLAILGFMKTVRRSGRVLLFTAEHPAVLNCQQELERMGHKDDRVTRAVYIHLTDQSREQGRAEVNRIFGAIEY